MYYQFGNEWMNLDRVFRVVFQKEAGQTHTMVYFYFDYNAPYQLYRLTDAEAESLKAALAATRKPQSTDFKKIEV